MKTFDIDPDDESNLSYYYNEFHVTGDLKDYLYSINHKKIRLTIEVLEDVDNSKELVTVTNRELFKRATDQTLNELGVNIWYMNEGGDPTGIIDIPKNIALQFMSEEEFNHRKHDKNS